MGESWNFEKKQRERFRPAQNPQQTQSIRGTTLKRPANATQEHPPPHQYKASGAVDDE